MNNYTAAISSFIRYDVVMFNTLEYVMKKDTYSVEAFKARREILKNELELNTPLKNCLDNSGEPGQKLKEKLNELIDTVYGADSTICKLGKDETELRVDFSQALTIFKLVMPIHEELRKIIEAHVAAARKNNVYDDEMIPDVLVKEEYFYRGLAYMLLLNQLDHLFAEYNKARSEAKGEITPQSNFIQNDINEVVGLFNLNRGSALIRSADYFEVVDPVFALIEMTSGRRDLPEGKNFGDVFVAAKKVANEHLAKWENAWKPVYEQFMKHFTEGVAELQKNTNQKA